MSLKLKHIDVKLQGEEILNDINMEIETGEFVSLLGESGCGKSTLLKSIAGLLEIEHGEIYLDDILLNPIAPEKRGAVIVFQDLRLFPHMTVEKNISFAMDVKRMPQEEKNATVKRLLEAVQLPGYEKRKIREMSGGQLQRVALARALAASPKILLLDEPFSGLNEKLRIEMGELVKKLHKDWKLTTVLVTHDKGEALRMSDRIAFMEQGEILQYDTPRQIYDHPSCHMVAEYFGRNNYVKGVVVDGEFRCELGIWDVDLADGEYEAMIRLDDMKSMPAFCIKNGDKE